MIKLNCKNFCDSCFSEILEGSTACSACASEKNSKKYPTALTEGTILAGRYVVGRVLGKGGFGITYLCYDTRENKTVAVKEYLPDHLTHRKTGETIVSVSGEEEYFKNGAQIFYNAARLAYSLNNTCVTPEAYNFFSQNNTYYFVMEYLIGVDMISYIKQKDKKISEKETLCVALKIAEALLVIHSADVLHGDVSPYNIFLCNDGKVKLMNLGTAGKIIDEASTMLRFECCLSLEQYQTKGKQGSWSDIYGFGASLYCALTGNFPDNAPERITRNEKLCMDEISDEFAKVLEKMLAIRIEDRYQNVPELKADFSALLIKQEKHEIGNERSCYNDKNKQQKSL